MVTGCNLRREIFQLLPGHRANGSRSDPVTIFSPLPFRQWSNSKITEIEIGGRVVRLKGNRTGTEPRLFHGIGALGPGIVVVRDLDPVDPGRNVPSGRDNRLGVELPVVGTTRRAGWK